MLSSPEERALFYATMTQTFLSRLQDEVRGISSDWWYEITSMETELNLIVDKLKERLADDLE